MFSRLITVAITGISIRTGSDRNLNNFGTRGSLVHAIIAGECDLTNKTKVFRFHRLSLSFRDSPNPPPPSASSLELPSWCFRSSGAQRSPALLRFSELVFSLPPPDSTLGTLDSVHASSLSNCWSLSSICESLTIVQVTWSIDFFFLELWFCVLYSDWCSKSLVLANYNYIYG